MYQEMLKYLIIILMCQGKNCFFLGYELSIILSFEGIEEKKLGRILKYFLGSLINMVNFLNFG